MTMRKQMNINFVRHSWFTRWSVTSTQNWGSYKKEQKKKKDGIVFEDRHQTNCWSWGGEWNKSSAELIRSSSPGKIGLTRDTIGKSFMKFGYIDVIQTFHFPLNSPHINYFACCRLVINVRYWNWFSINHDEPFWRGSHDHLICIPTVVYAQEMANSRQRAAQILAVYNLHKAENTFHKEDSSDEFHIFTHTPKYEYCYALFREKRKSDAIRILEMRQFQSVSFWLCYWMRMERISETH